MPGSKVTSFFFFFKYMPKITQLSEFGKFFFCQNATNSPFSPQSQATTHLVSESFYSFLANNFIKYIIFYVLFHLAWWFSGFILVTAMHSLIPFDCWVIFRYVDVPCLLYPVISGGIVGLCLYYFGQCCHEHDFWRRRACFPFPRLQSQDCNCWSHGDLMLDFLTVLHIWYTTLQSRQNNEDDPSFYTSPNPEGCGYFRLRDLLLVSPCGLTCISLND